MARPKKCNHDCFNCVHDDCIVEGISSEERKEMTKRDNGYFNTGEVKKLYSFKKRRYF